MKTVQQAVRAGQVPDLEQVSGNRHERRKQGRNNTPSPMPSEADLLLEMLSVLPHTVHASIMTEHESVWASLREEYLVTSASELVLTHGASIPGEWAMVGILNGRPDFGETEFQQMIAEGRSNLPPGLMNSAIGLMAQTMAPIIRTTLGRPASSFAVTPLLIFRSVNETA
jgi:hypothetical protein